MVGPRANWKGYIKFGEVTCPVALYTAACAPAGDNRGREEGVEAAEGQEQGGTFVVAEQCRQHHGRFAEVSRD
ncbi:hypothetical protein ABIA16_004929 [Sinorhizobium fredii]